MSIRDLGLLFRGLVLTITKRRLSVRRLVFYPLAMTVYLLFRVIVRLGQALDDLFFRGYRDQEVRSPVFVIAFPRSGTTFLHRLMCLDEEQFTFHKTYQTLLPAVSLYRFVGLFVALDRRMTALLPKLVRWFNRDLFTGWKGIHSIGLRNAEEDEGVFLYPVYTPVFYMLFPFMEQFQDLVFVDRLSPKLRQRIMDFYQRCLQRHLYAVREGDRADRRLLVKNVHSTGRIRSILERFPDARFVFIMRSPYQAIPSLLSLYYAAWQMHSPDIPKHSLEARALAQMGYGYYRYLREMCQVIPAEQYVCVGFEELIGDPESTIERIYDHLGLPLSDAFRDRLQAAIQDPSSHRSRHHYSLEEYGLSEQEVYQELQEVFSFWEEKRRAVSEVREASPSRTQSAAPTEATTRQGSSARAPRAQEPVIAD
jgi:hypothetical protein